jgi:hypothetical protein
MTDMDITGYDGIARSIAGGDPPPWLLGILPELIETVRSNVILEYDGPSREELRHQLEIVAKVAQGLITLIDGVRSPIPLISDPKQFPLYNILIEEDETRLPNWGETRDGLKFLADRAESKRAELIPTHGGRKPFHGLWNGPTASVFCALVTTLLWKYARGDWPGLHNSEVKEACKAVWTAAGGPERRHISDWTSNLLKSRAFRDTRDGATLVRQIEAFQAGGTN